MNPRIVFFPAVFLLATLALFNPHSRAGEAAGGRELYLKYCSSCHGQDGKGNGSVTPVLKVKAPDLPPSEKQQRLLPLQPGHVFHRWNEESEGSWRGGDAGLGRRFQRGA